MNAQRQDEEWLRYPDLSGKRVLITGAAGGLGRSMAQAFLAQGARLLLSDRNGEGLADLCRDLEGADGEVTSFVGTVTDHAILDDMFVAADKAYGGIDVLINNAGMSMNKPTLDLSYEDWQSCLEINLTIPFLCAQKVVPGMTDQGGGVILNISSMYGVVAAPRRLAYCATKSGLAMMTKVMAIEWANLGLRVNAIAPGYIRTRMVDELVETGQLNLEQLEKRSPQGRMGQPPEVAHLALFLASQASSYITGQIVGIDGGWTAYGYI